MLELNKKSLIYMNKFEISQGVKANDKFINIMNNIIVNLV